MINLETCVALLATLFCVFIAFFKWRYSYWRRKGLPFLAPKIPFGNTENPLTRDRNMAFVVKSLYEEVKGRGLEHAGVYVVAQPVYLPVDPELIKNVLAKDFQHFTNRGMYVNEKTDPLSANLFSIEGSKWKDLRTKLTPTFTSGKMKMMFGAILECGNALKETMNAYCEKREPVDIKEVLGCFTTDVIGSCAFGLECNSLKEPDNVFRKYSKDVFKMTRWRVLRNVMMFTLPSLMKALGIKMMNPEEETFFLNMVGDTVEYRKKNNYVRNDFMQLLIDLHNDNPDFTREQIAAQAFLFFVAGFETSSTTMSFALYELAVNGKIQEKAREEIQKVLEKHNGELTYDALQDMKYLGQIIDETLRKYPAAAFVTRRCTKDYKVEVSNVVLHKDTRVFIPVIGLHHDPEFFPEPEKFDPARFSDLNRKNIRQYTYLPFGEGPRNCIGARFGLMQTRLGLAILLRDYRFKVHSARTSVPLKFKVSSILLTAEGGIWLDVERIGD